MTTLESKIASHHRNGVAGDSFTIELDLGLEVAPSPMIRVTFAGQDASPWIPLYLFNQLTVNFAKPKRKRAHWQSSITWVKPISIDWIDQNGNLSEPNDSAFTLIRFDSTYGPFLGIYSAKGSCSLAVLNLDLTLKGNIEFGENSWRGDDFLHELRPWLVA